MLTLVGHSFDPNFMKLCLNVNPYKIEFRVETGFCWVSNQDARSNHGKPCVHSRGHNLEQKFMKLCQNVNSHKSKSNLNGGHIRSKTKSLGQIVEKKNIMYTREGTV